MGLGAWSAAPAAAVAVEAKAVVGRNRPGVAA